MKISFGKLPGIKRFRVPYRFHDPEEGKIMDRENRIRRELGMDIKVSSRNYTPNITGQIRQQREHVGTGLFARTERKRSNLRVMILVLVLLIFAIYFVGSFDSFPDSLDNFFKTLKVLFS